ncbi:MAG: methyltransferase domain-containing protein [Leptospirales bacterium]|nr:methyltransferase domain-containing protein [Leptospirales bacterium]
MSAAEYSAAVETARRYYNSADADAFYAAVWGGEDIHIGLYSSARESIAAASRRTVERLIQLSQPGPSDRVLDLGAGYGGAARFLAQHCGCRVDCVNLSEVQNARNRQLNTALGLERQIEVIDASFEDLPLPAGRYSVVWSQDALLHSGQRERAIAEAARVLASGGRFIFTDPMQSDRCDPAALAAVLERIHLKSMGSPARYCELGQQLGFTNFRFEEHAGQLVNHYSAVLGELNKRFAELRASCDLGYLQNMRSGLQRWIEAGRSGNLTWGVIQMDRR